WQSKKLQIQGAQILRNEAYLQYAAMTKDAAQRRSWTFYEAINVRFTANLKLALRAQTPKLRFCTHLN
ncbi:MAG: hypothetical protein ACETWT_03920, partial [Thermodesulfobacteriota bacterium]